MSYPTADTVARIRKLKVARRLIIPEHYVNFTVSYLLLLYYPKFCPVKWSSPRRKTRGTQRHPTRCQGMSVSEIRLERGMVIGTSLLFSMILSILNRYPQYAAYGIFRQLYGAICSSGAARHCATVPAARRRARGAEIPPRPRGYSTSPAPGFVRPAPKMPEFYPFQCSAIGSVQILGGLITYLLLAIYCRKQHNEPVSISRVRELRNQIANEADDLHLSLLDAASILSGHSVANSPAAYSMISDDRDFRSAIRSMEGAMPKWRLYSRLN